MSIDEALDRLEARLARLGPPISDFLRPGMPADETAARVRDATGFEPPEEAVAWFGWHNGVAKHDPNLAPPRLRDGSC